MTQPYRKPERVTPDDWAKEYNRKIYSTSKCTCKDIYACTRVEMMKMERIPAQRRP